MKIPIGREDGHVLAMGHRVSLERGGVPELKRRCLETLSHLNEPPDTVEFQRLWQQPVAAHESGERPAVQSPPAPATAQAQGRRRR